MAPLARPPTRESAGDSVGQVTEWHWQLTVVLLLVVRVGVIY